MCTIEILPEILKAGVYSLKIEGRMKRPEYAAGVTSIYRKYLDLYEKDPEHYQVATRTVRSFWIFIRETVLIKAIITAIMEEI